MRIAFRLITASLFISSTAAFALPANSQLDSSGYPISKTAKAPGITVSWQDSYRNILLVPIEKGANSNQHPLTINSEKLCHLLESITVKKNKDDSSPLFPAKAQEELCGVLSEALGQATPEQDIVLHYIHPVYRGMIVDAQISSIRIFAADDQLHFVFGAMRQEFGTIRKQYDTQSDNDFTENMWHFDSNIPVVNTGSRSVSNALAGGNLNAGRVGKLLEDKKNWLVFPLAATSTTQANISAAKVEKTTTVMLPVEERLKKLQQLKDKNLISDLEYQEKRKQILDSL